MIINKDTILIGSKVVLVPYETQHVPKYHDWMESDFLRDMTASERLTLEEEYEMQKSWRNDSNKCTFILIDPSETPKKLAGDVNFFLIDDEDATLAEIEVMIAEESCRRKGMAREALQHMMRYGYEFVGIRTFVAKIKESNDASISLFEKLGFSEISRSSVFQEVTLEIRFNESNPPACFYTSASFKDSEYASIC
eukprot:TRINITY_DN9557_c0_g2_i1.p1 TRINITY_DN9557_c0_g2~~TRINITY_DN9557_c0_g2_i1.p1  ORF type:complete len:195 (+),score=49.35 TRINITY_DN9557_c0_g2_i1:73-657(+)